MFFLSLIFMGLGIGVAELFAFAQYMNVGLGIDPSLTGLIIGLGWLFCSLSMLFPGKLADKFDSKKQYVYSSLSSAAIFALLFFTVDIPAVMLIYLSYSFVQGFSFTPRLKITAEGAGKNIIGRDLNTILGFYFGIVSEPSFQAWFQRS